MRKNTIQAQIVCLSIFCCWSLFYFIAQNFINSKYLLIHSLIYLGLRSLVRAFLLWHDWAYSNYLPKLNLSYWTLSIIAWETNYGHVRATISAQNEIPFVFSPTRPTLMVCHVKSTVIVAHRQHTDIHSRNQKLLNLIANSAEFWILPWALFKP